MIHMNEMSKSGTEDRYERLTVGGIGVKRKPTLAKSTNFIEIRQSKSHIDFED